MAEDCGWPFCVERCTGNPRCADPDGRLAAAAVADYRHEREEASVPVVGNKKFPYTPKGEAAAKATAQRTGQKMEVTKKVTMKGKK